METSLLKSLLVPVGGLVQHFITHSFIAPRIETAYIQSDHDYRYNRARSVLDWKRLNQYLQLSLYLDDSFSNDKNPHSIMYIKNSSNLVLDKITLKVSTCSYQFSEVQETIEFTEVEPDRIYSKELPQDFLIHLIPLEDGSYLCSFDSIKVKTRLIIHKGVEQQFKDDNIDYRSARKSDLIEYWNWTEHKGRIYNTKFINRAYENFRQNFLNSVFGERRQVIQQFQLLDIVLKKVFWVILLSNLYQINDNAQLARKRKNNKIFLSSK